MTHKQFTLKIHGKTLWEFHNVYNSDNKILKKKVCQE
jgi:hypothetical protein